MVDTLPASAALRADNHTSDIASPQRFLVCHSSFSNPALVLVVCPPSLDNARGDDCFETGS